MNNSNLSVKELTELVEQNTIQIKSVCEELSKVIVGQRSMIDRLMVGLLGDGHILVEGVPGLAKTTAIKALAQTINAQFGRIQFTPDLLPADLIGTQIFSMQERNFEVKKGPIFAHIILADEINRAPAKVQSALLEAMQEKQVTIGENTFPLPTPFLVFATQNPIEQEGTYPLPEAQMDRFMLKIKISYPTKEEEIQIMKRFNYQHLEHKLDIKTILTPDKIVALRKIVDQIFVDEKLFSYVADIVFATRNPKLYKLNELENLIENGASPRASIFLIRAAKAYAFIQGRAYVTPQDIKNIGADCLRHRITPSYEAEAQEMSSDDIIFKIFDKLDVP
jgi:MoxR-like ATPase